SSVATSSSLPDARSARVRQVGSVSSVPTSGASISIAAEPSIRTARVPDEVRTVASLIAGNVGRRSDQGGVHTSCPGYGQRVTLSIVCPAGEDPGGIRGLSSRPRRACAVFTPRMERRRHDEPSSGGGKPAPPRGRLGYRCRGQPYGQAGTRASRKCAIPPSGFDLPPVISRPGGGPGESKAGVVSVRQLIGRDND